MFISQKISHLGASMLEPSCEPEWAWPEAKGMWFLSASLGESPREAPGPEAAL